MCFGLKVRVVAVQPIDAAMGLEVRLLQNTPDTRTTHGPGVTLQQCGDQIVKTPAGGWQWYVAGLRVAIDITSRRCAGGKAPGPTRARRILQATEAVYTIATAPTANGMAVTIESPGHLKMRRAVRRR